MSSSKSPKEGDFLEEKTRAADILLGGLGFGEEAKLVKVYLKDDHYAGVAEWRDGERFEFESEDALTDLERWAVEVLTGADALQAANE